MSTPKDTLTSLLVPLAENEKQFKQPFIDAGFPNIPLPCETCLSLVQALPELFPLPFAEQIKARPQTQIIAQTRAIPVKRSA